MASISSSTSAMDRWRTSWGSAVWSMMTTEPPSGPSAHLIVCTAQL